MNVQRQASIAISLSAFCLLVSLILTPPSTSAASIANDSLLVSPAATNLQLAPSQTTASVTTSVNNQTNEPITVVLSAKDFGALGQGGTVSFYGRGYSPATNPHSLWQAIHFPTPSIELGPHASQKVTVELTNVNKLAAGGHFGAILFSPTSPGAVASGSNITIHSSVASLIFLETAEGGTQHLQLLPFHFGPLAFNLPNTMYVGLQNNGNTQTIPRGQLTLYSPSGNIVSTTVLNSGSGFILPGTSRVFTTSLPLGDERFARPGMYRLELQYQKSPNAPFTVVNNRFFYINFYLFVPVVIVIIAAIYAYRLYGHRSYRVVRKHVVRGRNTKKRK